jgi:hypothetical protein
MKPYHIPQDIFSVLRENTLHEKIADLDHLTFSFGRLNL